MSVDKTWRTGGLENAQTADDQELQMDRMRSRRDGSRWYAVMGVGMLFAGSFSTAFLVGGVLSLGYGLTAYGYWAWRMKRLYDPWKDEELDAWEDQHF